MMNMNTVLMVTAATYPVLYLIIREKLRVKARGEKSRRHLPMITSARPLISIGRSKTRALDLDKSSHQLNKLQSNFLLKMSKIITRTLMKKSLRLRGHILKQPHINQTQLLRVAEMYKMRAVVRSQTMKSPKKRKISKTSMMRKLSPRTSATRWVEMLREGRRSEKS